MNAKQLRDKIDKLENPETLEVFVVNYHDGNTYTAHNANIDQVYNNEIGQMAELPEGTKVFSIFIKPYKGE